jgi:hypothetical protein
MSVMSVLLATQKVIVLIVILSVDFVSSEIWMMEISEIPRVLDELTSELSIVLSSMRAERDGLKR